ncbi:MAG: UDP-N-acetylmuramoyl-L-alanyl-D-glutamate--2,6-diaminopimelate ligase [Candidatus Omnitrophica bacterium]|nr:UDP-N-acetylmuramoyl-L-alanyl-D-glutamate--2,6-diaminopimelate ligase [Candidatus Omnitrophota bacterium]
MRILKLIESVGLRKKYPDSENFKVSGISCNSKEVKENFVFVAVKGSCQDGGRFIDQAISNGARVVLHAPGFKRQVYKNVVFIPVKDTRKIVAKLAAVFYGQPAKKIKVVGITGTNGKTTISYLLEALVKKAGLSAAVIGTVNYRFKNKIIPAKNTTPGPLPMQLLLAKMVKENVDYVIIEASSHALDQDRTGEIEFHSAIFTNLTQDHLDYHKSLENYFLAKAKLFKNLGPSSFAVINNDDKYARRLNKLTKARVITYGLGKNSKVRATDIKFNLSHTEFNLCFAGKKIGLRANLIGRHNIYNMLAAAAWGIKAGLGLPVIKKALGAFRLVPGRLERVNNNKGFFVFVDYAHTEDALKNVLSCLRQLCQGRIITVFGCGGERDKLKRPKMGKVVSELSDIAIITNDNPRLENPLGIIKDIQKGIARDNYLIIAKRSEAIKKALLLAKEKDIILIAGKGHENYQVLKNRTIHFDDREAVKECLESMSY